MTKITAPRLLIAGTSSGCGKTTITCGLLSAIKQVQGNISAFKCGPDYIDPMFHKTVLQIPSYNLDSFFYEDPVLTYLFCDRAKELSLIEGVMGFYDGREIASCVGSSYDISKKLKIPTILLVNGKGTAHSTLPVIQGFLDYKNDHFIQGILLNHVSESTYIQLKPLIQEKFPQLHLLGYIPKLPKEFTLHSRHLGLILPSELTNLQNTMMELGKILSKTVDIPKIIDFAYTAPPLEYEPITVKSVVPEGSIHIGIAKDEAFSFYYEENLSILQEYGATLCPFSPLHDSHLPPNLDGIYFGGGYPELHLDKLSTNHTMIADIQSFLQDKKPFLAECGGYLYLTKSISEKPMVGFFPEISYSQEKLGHFGYVTLTAKNNNFLLEQNETIKGHEFHYFTSSHTGNDFSAVKPNGKQWEVGHSGDFFYGGFPHLAFYSNLEIPKNFIKKCMEKQYESRKNTQPHPTTSRD